MARIDGCSGVKMYPVCFFHVVLCDGVWAKGNRVYDNEGGVP